MARSVAFDADEIGLLREGILTLRDMKALTDSELDAFKLVYSTRHRFRGVVSLDLSRDCSLTFNPV